MQETTKTTKERVVALIYEQASQAHAERLTATKPLEQQRLDGEREGLRTLLKTIEREIPDETR